MKKCEKAKHATTYAAAKHIESLIKKRKNKGKLYSIYYHGECECYHVSQRVLLTSLSLIIEK